MVPTVAEVVSGAACQPVCQTISESAANVDTPTGKAAACRLARAVVGACCTVALAGAAGAACAGAASPTAHPPTASTAAANPVLIFIPVLSLDPIPRASPWMPASQQVALPVCPLFRSTTATDASTRPVLVRI